MKIKAILAGLSIGAALFLSIVIGGVVLTAMITVLAVYLGTLITLSRIPDEVPEDTHPLLSFVLKPLIKIKKFLWKHDLVLTVIMSTLAGSLVGLNTVTGVVTIALCMFLGDFLVMAFKELKGYALSGIMTLKVWLA